MVMRAIWKGTIGFGLVSIPVKMYNAVAETTPKLHMVHAECGSRIQLQRYCPHCQRVIEWKDVKSGYEYSKGQLVVLDEQDLESLPLRTLKSIDIEEFVEPAQLDPRACGDSFYLSPEETGRKPFWLLLKAMQATGLVAVGKLGYYQREYLAVIRPWDGCLLLQTMHYAEGIRSPGEITPAEVPISEKELSLAVSLINTLKTERFDLSKYHDEYGEALNRLIEAKLAGESLPTPEPVAQGGVLDLVESLVASIEASKSREGKGD
jgi:DNA end-binding protein Ku